jgi:hypothetical protein
MVVADSALAALWVQILPSLLAGALGLVGVVYGALWASRAETRRWLRQERLEAYREFLEIANIAEATIISPLVEHYGRMIGNRAEVEKTWSAINDAGDKIAADLRRPTGLIQLLGPPHMAKEATQVRLLVAIGRRVRPTGPIRTIETPRGPEQVQQASWDFDKVGAQFDDYAKELRVGLQRFAELAARVIHSDDSREALRRP